MSLNQELRLKRIYYQSIHRGCKESDYVLTKFANEYLYRLSQELIAVYEKFLLEEDVDIMAWVMGRKPVPEQYLELFKLINTIV